MSFIHEWPTNNAELSHPEYADTQSELRANTVTSPEIDSFITMAGIRYIDADLVREVLAEYGVYVAMEGSWLVIHPFGNYPEEQRIAMRGIGKLTEEQRDLLRQIRQQDLPLVH